MKTLLFEELILLSRSEKAARRIKFHPTSTVLKGINSTGKSSVLKSLYGTLGAESAKVHEKWENANVIASLKFQIDGIKFRMIRSGTRFTLFDAADVVVGSYTSVTKQLAPKVAELFAFHLLLRSASADVEVQATPAFLFLPFYIDQDVGWTDTINSFSRLKQFQSPKADVYAFHFGIKPSEYYAAKARASKAAADADPLRQEQSTTERILRDLEQKLQVADFNVDIEVFREEVDRLLVRCKELQGEEQRLRDRMNDTYNVVSSANDQIAITRRTLAELRSDRELAASLPGNDIQCPTCHTHYENGFAERFAIAVDEDRCIELLNKLDEEQRQAQRNYDATRVATQRARELVIEVESLLSVQREQLVLRDVVRSEGRRELRTVVGDRLSVLEEQLKVLILAESEARLEMKKLTDKNRSKAILDAFRAEFTRLLARLAVYTLPPASLKRPESLIRETGSTLSRAILAHFFASVKTIVANSTSAICPLVIDSPKQQDQDAASWDQIRQVINEERPKGTQLILAVGDDGGTDFGGDVIVFTEQHALLTKDEFEAASKEILPLIDASLSEEINA